MKKVLLVICSLIMILSSGIPDASGHPHFLDAYNADRPSTPGNNEGLEQDADRCTYEVILNTPLPVWNTSKALLVLKNRLVLFEMCMKAKGWRLEETKEWKEKKSQIGD